MDHKKDLYRYSDLKVLGYGSPSTIWRAIKRGDFPAPIDASGRPAWQPEKLEEWLATRPLITYSSEE